MKLKILIASMLISVFAFAQEEDVKVKEEKRGFDKSRLFTGGGITLSFSNNGTVLGATPTFGYSIAKWIDAGVLFNFIYATQRHVVYTNGVDYFVSNDKARQTIMGPGAFVRLYPVNFLFAQAQFEKNFIRTKYIFDNGAPSEIERLRPESFLVGAGYCQGRESSGDMFFYLSVMFDIGKNPNSPYVEKTAGGNINVLPIIRGGIQIPLSR